MQMDLDEKFFNYKNLLESIYSSIKEEDSNLDFHVTELNNLLREINVDSMNQELLKEYLDKYNIFNLHLRIGEVYEVKKTELQREINNVKQNKKAFLSYYKGKSDNRVFSEDV